MSSNISEQQRPEYSTMAIDTHKYLFDPAEHQVEIGGRGALFEVKSKDSGESVAIKLFDLTFGEGFSGQKYIPAQASPESNATLEQNPHADIPFYTWPGREIPLIRLSSQEESKWYILHLIRVEATILFHLKHPNIVEAHNYEEIVIDTPAGRKLVPVLEMEYIKGETLDHEDFTSKPLRERLLTYGEMANTIDYLHVSDETTNKQQVIHKDIKPQSFMIDYEGNIKLIDFGFSVIKNTILTKEIPHPDTRSFGLNADSEEMTGTLSYVNSHLVSGELSDIPLRDKWAYTVMLFEEIFGRHPFLEEADLDLSEPFNHLTILMYNTDPDRIKIKLDALKSEETPDLSYTQKEKLEDLFIKLLAPSTRLEYQLDDDEYTCQKIHRNIMRIIYPDNN
jgi:serine/threonine protein kinase